MELLFTDEAVDDLEYIRQFLIEAGVDNYHQIVGDLITGSETLLVFPYAGVKVLEADDPERLRDYYHKGFCLRYLLASNRIQILRVWHQRENERNS